MTATQAIIRLIELCIGAFLFAQGLQLLFDKFSRDCYALFSIWLNLLPERIDDFICDHLRITGACYVLIGSWLMYMVMKSLP